ncbi:Aste57867_5603 [Aphanomyces stellatus]|uniref:Aste57867_5603 protein n=1 Tax=Aphanomyces stellatus TaxID=120398 RepID=A0A485KD28_9STRA|nr:hypothetical protein As57867_005590 [Aphanomyces stellatus]VFT82649.1 Aste57867_5603 [Aphanomyces stellatus]
MVQWEEFDVYGEFVGVPLKLRLRFYEDTNCGIQVLECPDEIGFDNLAIWDTTYCTRQHARHLQGFINIRTPVILAKLRFVGSFDPEVGFAGKWFECWHPEQATGSFLFDRIEVPPRLPSANTSPLLPLMPGEYLFVGAALGGNGSIYPSRMTMHLLDDGTVRGHVQERHYPQLCALVGQWSPAQLSWSLTFRTDDSDWDYLYYGTPATRLMRGVWQRSDVAMIESLAKESGRFDFELTHAHRKWSRPYHHLFPQPFRQVAAAIVFARSVDRRTHLPSDLWCHVFSYVHADWWRS